MNFPEPGHDHARCTAELLARAEQICDRRGSRFTSQRRDVLNCIARSHAAIGAYEIIDCMAEHGPRPAPITVYRALEFLLAHGLVHKIESRNAFVACSLGHEGRLAALLICERCGVVAELDVPPGFEAMERAARRNGFQPRDMLVEVTGLCRSCSGGN